MDTTLVILAAGMGSRFGGLKQAAPITPDGKGILDFSVYDAKKAGFNKVVFIIRKEIEEDFKELVGNRIEKTIDVEYVLQDNSDLPEGRKKPFGTGQAILCCKDIVKTPFAIINSDDYYGPHGFEEIHRHLTDAKAGEYCMVAYQLDRTLSQNGTVNRGVCEIENDKLVSIEEALKIHADGTYLRNGEERKLPLDTPVSMNLWGLTTDIFPLLEKGYQNFLKTADLMNDEFFIQDVIFQAIQDNVASVKVYHNLDKWYGITYREDLKEVQDNLNAYIKDGYYPGF